MAEAAVRLATVTTTYGGAPVLDLDELAFERGGVHVLVGDNGAGKTTLLRVVAGLLRPLSGQVEVLGADIHAMPGRRRLEWLRQTVFCMQRPYLFNTTVLRNVEYGLRCRGTSRHEREARCIDAIEAVGLAGFEPRRTSSLSGGEAQRVAIARALVLAPALVLLDEPVAHVDHASRALVEQAIARLHAEGSTVVVATHQLEQAYHLSASVTRLDRGRVAPPALENLLEGEIVQRDGDGVLVLPSGTNVHVVTEKRGHSRATVDPRTIIVSAERLDSSARNCLRGRIVGLSERESQVSVTVDVGVPLTAYITYESYGRGGISVGGEVFLTFKASSVAVF